MRFLRRCKDVEYIEINPVIFKKLKEAEIAQILETCDEKTEGILRAGNLKIQ